MQNNDNQTNQKDPANGGQNGFETISPGLCSIWLSYQRRILKNIKLSSSIFVRYLSSYRDLNILVFKVEIFK